MKRLLWAADWRGVGANAGLEEKLPSLETLITQHVLQPSSQARPPEPERIAGDSRWRLSHTHLQRLQLRKGVSHRLERARAHVLHLLARVRLVVNGALHGRELGLCRRERRAQPLQLP
eukprot:4998680-Pleurochrysis_carterae.AAC.1